MYQKAIFSKRVLITTVLSVGLIIATLGCSTEETNDSYSSDNQEESSVVTDSTEKLEIKQESVVTIDNFTKDMKLEALFESEEMEDFAYFLISRSESYADSLREKTLTQINEEAPTWNAQSMEDGINHMLDLIHDGVKVDYDFWSVLEREMDIEKENTKLFYFPGEEDAPFVLLCAGGGYTAVCTMVESFPVAQRINELGYNVFVLSYRVNVDNTAEKAMEDVAESLKYILAQADEFKISTENYAMGGFSAGSNLIADWGVEETGWGKYGLPKPSSLFLVYGGISNRDDIDSNYPPSFIVYCLDDPVVASSSMLGLETKLEEQGVLFKVKSGETGGHGFGLGTGTDVEGWVEEAIMFWQNQN